jgi:hypothetical protein
MLVNFLMGVLDACHNAGLAASVTEQLYNKVYGTS